MHYVIKVGAVDGAGEAVLASGGFLMLWGRFEGAEACERDDVKFAEAYLCPLRTVKVTKI